MENDCCIGLFFDKLQKIFLEAFAKSKRKGFLFAKRKEVVWIKNERFPEVGFFAYSLDSAFFEEKVL